VPLCTPRHSSPISLVPASSVCLVVIDTPSAHKSERARRAVEARGPPLVPAGLPGPVAPRGGVLPAQGPAAAGRGPHARGARSRHSPGAGRRSHPRMPAATSPTAAPSPRRNPHRHRCSIQPIAVLQRGVIPRRSTPAPLPVRTRSPRLLPLPVGWSGGSPGVISTTEAQAARRATSGIPPECPTG